MTAEPVPLPARQLEFRREGLGYLFEPTGGKLRFLVDYLKRRSDGLYGDVWVEDPAAARATHIHHSRYLLSGPDSRVKLARMLERISDGAIRSEDALRQVEVLFSTVCRWEDRGQPVVRVGRMERAARVPDVVERLAQAGEFNLWYGAQGCVAGETEIDGPDGAERIDVLARRRQPIRVWALGPDGPVIALATAPFLKGRATLYRFELSCGRSITVMDRHRFLTPDGWRFASELHGGARLAVCDPARLRSRPSSRSAWREDGQHSWRIPAGCSDRCSTGVRRCDRQPLPGEADDRVPVPSPGGAREHTRWTCDAGDRAPLSAHSPADPRPGHPSRSDCVPGGPCEQSAPGRPVASPHSRRAVSSRSARRSRQACGALARDAVPHPPAIPVADRGADTVRPSLPPLDCLPYSTVSVRTVERVDDYYDLHVPGYENYLANGVWNHNSAKGWLGVAAAVCHATAVPLAGLAVGRGVPLYLDWETTAETLDARVKVIAAGLKLAQPPEIAYRQCLVPLARQVNGIARQIAELGVTLVIVDSLGHAFGSPGEHGTYEDAALEGSAALRALGLVTVIGIDHLSAEAIKEKVAGKAMGSVRKMADARVAWEIRRSEEGDQQVIHLGLFHTKFNNTPRFPALGIRVEFEPGAEGELRAARLVREDAAASEDHLQRFPALERMEAVLRHGAMRPKEIAERTKLADNVTRAYLSKYENKRFVRVGDGIWGLMDQNAPRPLRATVDEEEPDDADAARTVSEDEDVAF